MLFPKNPSLIRILKALCGLLCPCVQVTKWSLTLIMRMHACNRPSLFLAPSQCKSNLLWSLAESPLRLEPLLIYGMQMHHLQSILRCEKVIGRPCVLPWMICINYYSLCSSWGFQSLQLYVLFKILIILGVTWISNLHCVASTWS